MKKYLYFVALMLTTTCLQSCLDENPKDQISEDELFSTSHALVQNTVATLYYYIGGDSESQGLQGTARGVYDYNEITTDNNTSDTNPTSSQTLTWYDEDGQAAIDTTPNLPLPARPLFPLAGPLTDLPSEATDGTVYFDTTNHRPLWATHLSDGVGHTFLAWVDATGTPVAS